MSEDIDDLHVAVIPDGNRSYAEERGLPRAEGHRIGGEKATDFLGWADDYPRISEVTAWALSPANYRKRPDKEIENLNSVYREYAEELNRDESMIHGKGMQVDIIGDSSILEEETQRSLRSLTEDTSDHGGMRLNLAVFYDSSYDIDQALENARSDGVDEPLSGDLKPYYEIDEVDVLVRYGEDSAHLSGFAPMQQLRRATLFFPGKNWPEAEKEDIDRALEEHDNRDKTRGA
ncbi:MAG: undecaprenyl diphosphate synthase family protein [Candidatus Nanohaloarchaea archaeon]